MKQIYFIINPKARNGYCLTIWKKVEAALINRQYPSKLTFQNIHGHAINLAEQIAKRIMSIKSLLLLAATEQLAKWSME